jgi:galactokinase
MGERSDTRARAAFERAFSSAPAAVAAGPGRVNIIGEHTDYNDGYVLPMPLPLACAVAAGISPDGEHHVFAADLGETWACPLDVVERGELGELRPGSWQSYVLGVMHGVAQCLRDAGEALPAVRLAIASDVPMGSGLSSSAALEVAVARALAALKPAWRPDALQIAELCRNAEHRFAGVPCGIMDQLIASAGTPGSATVIDCRTKVMRFVPLPDPRMAKIVVVDTGVRHSNSAGTYAARRKACAQAAEVLGIAALRDADGYMLDHARPDLTEEQWACASHVVAENQRVLMAGEAMRAGDMASLGELMKLSHASLRNLFRVSCPELDCLVEAACAVPGVFGARMTGAGLGGCVVSVAKPDAVAAMKNTVNEAYHAAFGRTPTWYEL